MKEFEIIDEEEDSYTVVKNNILRNKTISNAAIGLLSKMTSLPPEWDYSFNGLVSICKEGKCAIRNQINELKTAGYIKIASYRNEKGYFQYKYTVYKKPHLEIDLNKNYPTPGFRVTDNRTSENQPQINTNKQKLNNKDKEDKTKNISHNFLTLELFKMDYIKEDDSSSFYFDDLFKEYLSNGYSYRELLGAIHYIVPRVINRHFIDEDGNEITNKYGYLKSSIEANFRKLNNLSKNLYSDDEYNWLEDCEL